MNPRSTGDAVNCTQLVVHCSIHKEINRKWPVRNDGLWPCKEKSVLLLLQKRPIFQIARCARFVFWYFERICKIDMGPFPRLFLSKLAFKSNCLDPGTTYRDWQSNFAGWCIAWLACHFTSAYVYAIHSRGLVPGAGKTSWASGRRRRRRVVRHLRLCCGVFDDSESRRVENDSRPYWGS